MVPAVLRERMRAEGGRTHSYLSAARLTEELWLLSQQVGAHTVVMAARDITWKGRDIGAARMGSKG